MVFDIGQSPYGVRHGQLTGWEKVSMRISPIFYNPETGWVMRGGKRAGTICTNGYRYIRYNRKPHLEHRLIWFMFYGEWPPKHLDIDHIDRDKTNNKISNLRLATRSQNHANAGCYASSTTGVRGVHLDNKTGRYVARVVGNRKQLLHRTYPTLEEATHAVIKKRKEVWGEYQYIAEKNGMGY